MRIFYSFIILVTSAILWLLPITEAVYDFRTDVRDDNFYVTTAVGETTANVTLHSALYENDTSKFSFYSDLASDVPVFVSYNGTSRVVAMTGYSANNTRTLTVTYDVDALSSTTAIDTLLDIVPWIWYLLIICFPVAGLAAIFMGKI